MRAFAILTVMVAGLALAGCSKSKFVEYDGPEVTQVFISKKNRKLYLLHGEEVLKSYRVDLGFTPEGHKGASGDGKTPEGYYWIYTRNPNSAFHLSLKISYPNSQDIAAAAAAGVEPGGNIFIHGQPNREAAEGPDWTAGCIAVSNSEMEEIYAMVKDMTPIYIAP